MATKTLPTRRVKIIGKKEFAVAALDIDDDIIVMHIAALIKLIIISIYHSREAQITLLISTKIFIKYFNLLDVFSSDLTVKFLEYTRIHDHSIDLLKDKQPPYGLIYSLGPVKLEILKTYIKANLASGFIRLFKFPFGAVILFVWKKHNSLYLYVDYQGLNNLIIKNCYLLPLICQLLNRLNYAKHFI